MATRRSGIAESAWVREKPRWWSVSKPTSSGCGCIAFGRCIRLVSSGGPLFMEAGSELRPQRKGTSMANRKAYYVNESFGRMVDGQATYDLVVIEENVPGY